MSQPKVTILMPAYNASLYIKEAIESMLNQTFTDFELLIINDGSNDNTESLVSTYIKEDSRFLYIKNKTTLIIQKIIANINNYFLSSKQIAKKIISLQKN